jgi:hypothetical protein
MPDGKESFAFPVATTDEVRRHAAAHLDPAPGGAAAPQVPDV